jgi:AcrR family transcriptional regulator
MARPRSEEKFRKIITAAARVFSQQGLSAPTSFISNEAGVGEGTVFIYFKTKDALFDGLYRHIKLDLAGAMTSYPNQASVKARLEYVWDCYVNWGVSHQAERKTLVLLESSNCVSAEALQAGRAPFRDILAMVDEATSRGLLRDLSRDFILGTLQALAHNTMDFMAAEPKAADRHRIAGFKIFWSGITRKKD